MNSNFSRIGSVLFFAAAVGTAAHGQQITAFTYQGQLRDSGTNANGTYAMTFKLYDAENAGSQIGGTVASSLTLANGLFTVNLDFGAGAFNGNARWLEIAVAGETLTPRVQVLPAPYALFAAAAASTSDGAVTTAKIADGSVTNPKLAANAVGTTNVQDDAITDSKIASVSGSKVSGAVALAAYALSAGSALPAGTSGGVPNGMRIFAADGTFVVPTNITRIMVEVWGGGGGGGGAYWDSSNPTNAASLAGGGGGASGGYALQFFTVTNSATYAVTVGDGGSGGLGGVTSPVAGAPGTNSSFGGSLLVAQGGGGGGAGSNLLGMYLVGGVAGAAAGASSGSVLAWSGSDTGVEGSAKAPWDSLYMGGGSGGQGGTGFRGGRGGVPGRPNGILGGGGAGGGLFEPNSIRGQGGRGGGGGVIITY